MQVAFKDDVKTRQCPVFVKLDRARNNVENLAMFDDAELQLATEFYAQVCAAYPNSHQKFLDYNKKSINIKVNRPIALDKLSDAVHNLNKAADQMGAELIYKQSSITYKICQK